MPQLPNSPDVSTKDVNPSISPILPDAEGMNIISKESTASNFVEQKIDILPLVTPPTDFVSKRLDQFGESMDAGRKIDPEFERWFAQQGRPEVDPAIKEKQITEKATKFQTELDKLNAESQAGTEALITAPRKALREVGIGALDALNTAGRTVIDLANASRRFFGVQELEQIPSIADSFGEPKGNKERFIRSSAKFMAALLPISKGLRVATGISGVANTIASTGAYGFLFDEDKTSSIVNDFVQQNLDIAPDILSYLDHKIDDGELAKRFKNMANYSIDAAAMEGVFHGLKFAKELATGKTNANKVLTGEATTRPEEVVNYFADAGPIGLTTEEVGKSTKDILQSKMEQAMADIEGRYIMKQSAVPDRMTQGRLEALAEIKKNPMTLEQLLDIPENAPVNNLVVMQAEIASEGLKSYGKDILEQATQGKADKTMTLYRLINIADKLDDLTFPRSTAGRALESAKFISSLDVLEGGKKLPIETIKKMANIFGNDVERIFAETDLIEKNLSGFPMVDAVLNASRENIDPKKIYKYLNSARINWILSDPSIHGANITANTMVTGLRTATDVVARGVTLGRGIFGNQYLAKGVQEGEARAVVQGYIQGMGKGFSIIGENIETMFGGEANKQYKPIYSRDSNTKYNKAVDEIIAQSDVANNFEQATLGKKLVHTVGHIVGGTPVGKLLSWEDDFFKGMHYMATVNSELAIMESNMNRLALQAETPEMAQAIRESHMSEINAIRENFKNGVVHPDIDAKAMADANYWTFNSEIAGNDLVSKYLYAGEVGIQTAGKTLKWFVPFYRTGANIGNMAMEYTPVLGGILKMGNVGGVAGLLRGGAEADKFIAKQVIGSGVLATTAIALSKLEEQFGLDFELGSTQDNKVGIKIGDLKTTVDKQNIIFKLMIASRDIMDIANIAGEEKGASRAAQASASLLAEMYSPLQLVKVMGMFSELSNGATKEIPTKLINMLEMNIVSQVTPYSGLSKFVQRDIVGMNKPNIGKEHDETLLDEMVKRIKHTYLGDDANIPARRGLFGQEIPYLRTFGYQVSDKAHDLFYGENMTDPVMVELLSLTKQDVMSNPGNYDSLELNNTTFLDMPPRSIQLPTGEEYKLTPKEYSEFVQASAGNNPAFDGNALKESLSKYITSSDYQKLPPKYRVLAIKKMVGLYRKVAKGILIRDNVDVNIEARRAMENLKQEFLNIR